MKKRKRNPRRVFFVLPGFMQSLFGRKLKKIGKRKKGNKQKSLFFSVFGRTRMQQLGTLLMIIAGLLLIYIYYPLAQLFFPAGPLVAGPNSILIPKINVEAPIIWNVDPFNEKEYRDVLTHGVAQAKGTAFPAQDGTMYIFAHSSDFPWRITRYNVIFFRLGELVKGDKIIVSKDGRHYIYKVRELKTVSPSEVYYLTKEHRTQLILQTCTPVGTDWFRLLVFANPAT